MAAQLLNVDKTIVEQCNLLGDLESTGMTIVIVTFTVDNIAKPPSTSPIHSSSKAHQLGSRYSRRQGCNDRSAGVVSSVGWRQSLQIVQTVHRHCCVALGIFQIYHQRRYIITTDFITIRHDRSGYSYFYQGKHIITILLVSDANHVFRCFCRDLLTINEDYPD